MSTKNVVPICELSCGCRVAHHCATLNHFLGRVFVEQCREGQDEACDFFDFCLFLPGSKCQMTCSLNVPSEQALCIGREYFPEYLKFCLQLCSNMPTTFPICSNVLSSFLLASHANSRARFSYTRFLWIVVQITYVGAVC